MKIISHRGYWLDESEKNQNLAFKRSFQLGFGTETDIRDSMGRLVISHDMPSGSEQGLDSFLALVANYSQELSLPLTIALNVKADGMANVLSNHLKRYQALDFFVFDMSVPDMRSYLSTSLPVFTRMSEAERIPAFLEQAEGVWLDSFDSEWYTVGVVEELLQAGKRVCVVSPELHGRPYKQLWSMLSKVSNDDRVILCTDKPEEALSFFREI